MNPISQDVNVNEQVRRKDKYQPVKKALLALFIASHMLVAPLLACADVLAIGWEESSKEELAEAMRDIEEKIREIESSELPAEDSADVVHYEGNGLSMIEIDSFPFFPCRMVLALDDAVDAKIEITGGRFDWEESFKATKDEMTTEFSYDKNNYGSENLTVLITTTANWTLDISPLTDSGLVEFAGKGSAIGDIFYLDAPKPVTITYDGSANDIGYIGVQLVDPSDFGYLREYLLNEMLYGDKKTGSIDVFVKPGKYGSNFYIIECSPGTTWSIEP